MMTIILEIIQKDSLRNNYLWLVFLIGRARKIYSISIFYFYTKVCHFMKLYERTGFIVNILIVSNQRFLITLLRMIFSISTENKSRKPLSRIIKMDIF